VQGRSGAGFGERLEKEANVFRSLRFKVPALFLAAIVLAGLVSTAVPVSVLRSSAQSTLRKETFKQLGSEARGITQIYANSSKKLGCPPPSRELELASGDQVFYIPRAKGIDVFPCATPAYTVLPRRVLDFSRILDGQSVHLEFTPLGTDSRLLGVARPVKLADQTFGAVILARKKTRLNQSWLPYAWRLLPAFFAGILVAGALGWDLSRRITKPVLALSNAAYQVAAGQYGGAVPPVPGRDEISHLSERFNEMAAELQAADALERNFLMTVSHELRTPLTAIRGHVEALLEGVVEDEEARSYSLEVISLAAERLDGLCGGFLARANPPPLAFRRRGGGVGLGRLAARASPALGEEPRRRGIDSRRSVTATPVLETDGDRVLQVISNLLANAFRWT